MRDNKSVANRVKKGGVPELVDYTKSNISLIRKEGWQCVFGGIVLQFSFGIILAFGGLSPYYASWLRSYNYNTSFEHISLIFPSQLIFLLLGLPLGSFLMRKYGYENTITFSVSLVSLGLIASSFLTYSSTFIMTYSILVGLGVGSSYLAPFISAHKYFPSHRNLITCLLLLANGIGALTINMAIQKIINPVNEDPSITVIENNTRRNYFGECVCNEMEKMMRVLAGLILIMGSIGVSYIYYPQDLRPSVFTDEDIQFVRIGPPKKDIPEFKNITEACSSKNFLLLILVYSLTLPFSLFIISEYKNFGLVEFQDDYYSSLLGGGCSLLVTAVSLFTSFLYSRIGFRFTLTSLLFNQAVGLIILSMSIQKSTLGLSFGMIMVSVSLGGLLTCLPRFISEYFGDKVKCDVFLVIGIAPVLANLALCVLLVKQIYVKNYADVFINGGGFTLIGLTLALLIHERKQF